MPDGGMSRAVRNHYVQAFRKFADFAISPWMTFVLYSDWGIASSRTSRALDVALLFLPNAQESSLVSGVELNTCHGDDLCPSSGILLICCVAFRAYC